MTVREALSEGARLLGSSGSESPSLDAALLLGLILGVDRPALLTRYPDALPDEAASSFRELLARRASGEPVAYLLGRREFWGRDFLVDRRVLVPRPETEGLVEAAREAALGLAAERERRGLAACPLRLHDAFTGSGCVGIALYLELKAAFPSLPPSISFSDKSLPALELAGENARRLLGPEAGGFPFLLGDVLDGVEGPFDIITANPPYLTDNEMDELRARGNREPELALSGGADGLEPYRRLTAQARERLAEGGWLLVEIGWTQAEAVASLLAASGYREVSARRDLAGRDRVVAGRTRCRSS